MWRTRFIFSHSRLNSEMDLRTTTTVDGLGTHSFKLPHQKHDSVERKGDGRHNTNFTNQLYIFTNWGPDDGDEHSLYWLCHQFSSHAEGFLSGVNAIDRSDKLTRSSICRNAVSFPFKKRCWSKVSNTAISGRYMASLIVIYWDTLHSTVGWIFRKTFHIRSGKQS